MNVPSEPAAPSPNPDPSKEPSSLPLAKFFDSVRSWGVIRSEDRIMGGVAAAIAKKCGFDPNAVRLVFVVSLALGGMGVVLYALAWLILPQEDGRIHAQFALKGNYDNSLIFIVLLLLAGSNPDALSPRGFLQATLEGAVLLLITLAFTWVVKNSGKETETSGQKISLEKVKIPSKKSQRNGWLIVMVSTAAVLLVTFAAQGTPYGWGNSFPMQGERVRVTSMDQAENGFVLGTGDATLDFSNLKLDEDLTVPVRMVAGDLLILLPENIDASVNVKMGAGDITWAAGDDDKNIDGLNLNEDFYLGNDSSVTVNLEVEVNAGSLILARR